MPPTATCDVTVGADATPIVAVVYPADWFTVDAPPTLACRYFDPAAIIVPADPTTLTTAVMIKTDTTTAYADALAAATDPANWTVITNEPVSTSGLPAVRLETTSINEASGYPVGTTRYGYIIDFNDLPIWVETSGDVGDPTFATNMSVVDLIASQAAFAGP